MTLINGDLLPPLSASEIEARDPLILHAKRKAELRAEAERHARRGRRRLDVQPLTPADVDQRVGASQEAQNKAIGMLIGEAQAEMASLREQIAELKSKLSFVEGLLQGSSSGAKLKFFNVRGAWCADARYDRTDVVECKGSWYAAKRDDPRGIPGDGEDWQIGPVGRQGERGLPGARGLRGREGAAGKDAPTILYWLMDRRRYLVTPVMTDGTRGSTLELRGLFEQFFMETSKER